MIHLRLVTPLIFLLSCSEFNQQTHQSSINYADLIHVTEKDFDGSVLGQLKPAFKNQPGIGGNPWAVIGYYSKLSCMTCVDREISELKAMDEELNGVDVYIISSHYDSLYLNSIKRVSKIRFPILIETFQGQSGINSDQMVIALIDLKKDKIVLEYHPVPDPTYDKAFSVFKTRVAELIKL